jgi:predicted transposase YdaD
MHKPYDTTLKQLLDDYGADWCAWLAKRLGYTPGPVEMLNTELDTVQIAADRVVRFSNDEEIVHLEVQASWDGDLPNRLLEYNVYLHRREGLPIHSVAILLCRDANARAVTGELTRRRRNGRLTLQFEYDVIRAWELKADELLSENLGIAPLALLTDDAAPRLTEVVNQFATRVEQEIPELAQQSQLLANSSILMGLRYDESQVMPLFRGIQAMKESSVYRALIAEGEAKGEVKGEAKGLALGEARGEANAFRVSLVAILEQKFGSVPPDIHARITATTDVAKLQTAIRQVLSLASPHDVSL